MSSLSLIGKTTPQNTAPLRADELVEGCFLVTRVSTRSGRKGRMYRMLTLSDGQQEIAAFAHADCPPVQNGQAVKVIGYRGHVRGEQALTIRTLEVIQPKGDATSGNDLTRLTALLSQITPPYRELVDRIVEETPRWVRICRVPASLGHHHSYLGGLLRHTIEVIELGLHLYPVLSGTIDPNLLLTTAFLHDLGKSESYTEQPPFAPTPRGARFSHELLGLWSLLPVLEQTPSLSRAACDRLLVTLRLMPAPSDSPLPPEQEVLRIADRLSVELSRSGLLTAA